MLLIAIEKMKIHTTETLQTYTQELYENWIGELAAGGQVLTARGGKRYLHKKIRIEKREIITASGLDALIYLFQIFAFRDGLLKLNPRYTGKAPYPRFIRVWGK